MGSTSSSSSSSFPILLGLFGIAVIIWVILLIDYAIFVAADSAAARNSALFSSSTKNNNNNNHLVKKKKRDLFLFYGMGLMLFLNGRYFIDGPSDSIAFFVGIYDVMHNFVASKYYCNDDDNVVHVGASTSSSSFYNDHYNNTMMTMTTTAATTSASASASSPPVALIPCIEDDICSVWDDSDYHLHVNWGVSFYNRFNKNSPQLRTTILLIHILFNTLAFVGMMYQIYNNPTAATTSSTTDKNKNNNNKNQRHVLLGWLTLTSLVLGTGSAVILSMEHGDIDTYGGNFAKYGFMFMASCVLGTGTMRILVIRRNNNNSSSSSSSRASRIQSHKRWMNRCAGSMWGSFWIFRAMELVLGPFLTHYKTLSLQLCIWLSAPLGILIAELVCNRRQQHQHQYHATTTETLTKTSSSTTTTTTVAHVKQA